MANFSGHLYGAAGVSSAGALGVYSLGWAGPEQTQMLFFLGVSGGLLPDIDSDNSTPVRYGVFEIFARFTVHRGVWHSWLGMAFAGLASANAAFHFAELSAWDAWLAGAFVVLGYATHLLLDEIASVDLLGKRVRRSFGTALKPFSVSYPWASVAMLAAVIALSVPAPTVRPVLEAGSSRELSMQALHARVVGEQGWLADLRGFLE